MLENRYFRQHSTVIFSNTSKAENINKIYQEKDFLHKKQIKLLIISKINHLKTHLNIWTLKQLHLIRLINWAL